MASQRFYSSRPLGTIPRTHCPPMANITITLGAFLVLLGVGGYVASGQASWTALIPAFFGLIFVALGVLARREARRRHAMHAAVTVALLGFLATVQGVGDFVRMMTGDAIARPAAATSQALMALLCAAFLAL